MKLQVKIENQTFDVEVGNLSARPIMAVVDGESFQVFLEESGASDVGTFASVPSASSLATAAVASPPAATVTPTKGGKSVVAPIPGTIVGISVKVGDTVEHGQELCALEAMKMKNAIRATRSGKIGSIYISVGDQVKHSQVLLDFTE